MLIEVKDNEIILLHDALIDAIEKDFMTADALAQHNMDNTQEQIYLTCTERIKKALPLLKRISAIL